MAVTTADDATTTPQHLERLGRLYTAVVADSLDRLGARNQVMAPHIRPLYPTAHVIGRAMTVQCVTVDAMPAQREDYYRGELQAVDALTPGDVMVVSTCQGSYWGELLATAARYRGATGIVLDAYGRDTLALIDMDFPTFWAGISCADSLGRIDVSAVNTAIQCGGVTVHAGDLLLGDHDGVVVIPTALVEETLRLAEEKVSGENMVREKLAGGMPVHEAFLTYGVI
jgi:4-hydroxy-4-methyl-2-oxoglutarate aldolase